MPEQPIRFGAFFLTPAATPQAIWLPADHSGRARIKTNYNLFYNDYSRFGYIWQGSDGRHPTRGPVFMRHGSCGMHLA
jgi:hypothetical protein